MRKHNQYKFIIIYFFFCLFFFTFFASGMVDSQDGFQYLAIARQIYYRHSLAMPKEKYPDNLYMNTDIGFDQQVYSPTGLGFSLALIPAVMFEDFFYI